MLTISTKIAGTGGSSETFQRARTLTKQGGIQAVSHIMNSYSNPNVAPSQDLGNLYLKSSPALCKAGINHDRLINVATILST